MNQPKRIEWTNELMKASILAAQVECLSNPLVTHVKGLPASNLSAFGLHSAPCMPYFFPSFQWHKKEWCFLEYNLTACSPNAHALLPCHKFFIDAAQRCACLRIVFFRLAQCPECAASLHML